MKVALKCGVGVGVGYWGKMYGGCWVFVVLCVCLGIFLLEHRVLV
jgi:hypothetical protein